MATSPPQIGKYQIVRRLGHGGMGTVYLGRDSNLNRPVAIKVMREALVDDELLERFLREARATANLRHENLVTIYEVDQHDHQPFIAMEYVDGTTLAEVIKRRQQLPLAQKCSFVEQICAGLHHAHRVGIVHRDIKPANVMVDAQGVIRILDFGIARVANSAMTSDGAMLGTLNYMSPEQMLGRPVDFRSDIFSVGAVAYELLSYHQAFPGSLDDGLLQRLPQADAARLAGLCPELPEELEQIVLRALAKHPHDRFADLDEMRVAIGRARSSVDPHLQVETVVIPSVNRSPTRPASSDERRGLLERRARQIAVHRDAARAALARGDLESAAAACEDALTLDPDDPEASQLLGEIRQEKERHDHESKAKRERERTLRQRVADTELAFARGDIAAAVRLLAQVFTDEPRDPAALTLLGKVREAATAAGIVLPDVLRATSEPASPDAAPRSTQSMRGTGSSFRRVLMFAAAAVLVLAIGGVVLWMNRPDEAQAPSGRGGSSTSGGSPSVSSAGTANPSAPVRVDPNVVTPQGEVAASQSNPPVTPAPAAAPPTVADSLSTQLARIAQLNQQGNVAAALAELDRIGPSDDQRVTALARSVALGAARSMDAALAVAASQKAAELAPVPYAAAEQARRIADAASNRSDYVQAGRQALVAADAYRRAESEARVAAATTAKPGAPPAGAAATPAPASPSPIPEAPVPPRTETPAAAAPSPSPAAIPGAGTLAGERPGIMRALQRYQDAYSARSLSALRAVYPSLPQETSRRLDSQFRGCRAYDVSFGNNMSVSLVENDPTAATVTVPTTYLCQPATNLAAEQRTVRDVFSLRKTQGEWLIESMADTAR